MAPKPASTKQKVSPKQLSHEVSEHLTNARWRQALDGLFALTQCEASAVKLGSLQRWVRDADAARDDAPEPIFRRSKGKGLRCRQEYGGSES